MVSALFLSLALFSLSTDLIRLHWKPFNRVVCALLLPFMRKEELHTMAGTTPLLWGAALISLYFPPPITQLSLWLLAFVDPAASTVGVLWGKNRLFNNKSWEGFAGGFLAGLVVSLFLGYPLGISLTLALIASIAELISIADWDDNFTLPILTASGAFWLFTLLGML
jgi:diacylglycerol kinase (CTP)